MFFFAFQFNVWTCNRINKLLWQTKLLHYANSKSLFLITHPSLPPFLLPSCFFCLNLFCHCLHKDGPEKEKSKTKFFFHFQQSSFFYFNFYPPASEASREVAKRLFYLSSNQNQKPIQKKFARLAARAVFVSSFLLLKPINYDFFGRK